MNQDLLNGIFEFVGSLTIWANVRKLHADKEVKGSHWEMMIFFAAWAGFNLIYYPHLNQMWSLAGAISMFVAEWAWVGMAAYYSWQIPPSDRQIQIDGVVPRIAPQFHKTANIFSQYAEALKNPYSPESILALQRKFGGDDV
jgi:hypothetical protein